MAEQANANEMVGYIADTIQWWLDYDEKANGRAGGSAVHDEMSVIPPVWPSRGQLKRWVGFMREVAETSEPVDGLTMQRPPIDWVPDAIPGIDPDTMAAWKPPSRETDQ